MHLKLGGAYPGGGQKGSLGSGVVTVLEMLVVGILTTVVVPAE